MIFLRKNIIEDPEKNLRNAINEITSYRVSINYGGRRIIQYKDKVLDVKRGIRGLRAKSKNNISTERERERESQRAEKAHPNVRKPR